MSINSTNGGGAKGSKRANPHTDLPEGMATLAVNTTSMDRFVQSFEKSARRWEIVVYPALFAFVLLAGYGFFLIYSLTSDMRVMAQAIDPDMSKHMRIMSQSVNRLTDAMLEVSTDMNDLTGYMSSMNDKMDNLGPMRVHVANMETSMRGIVVASDQMRQSMALMTHQFGRPMSIMNSILP